MATAPSFRELFPGAFTQVRTRELPFAEPLQLLGSASAIANDLWAAQRREAQTPPDWEWQIWLLMAGRGFGKTRTGAEWSREQVMYRNRRIMHFVAPTAGDARDVMVEGPAGFMKVCEAYGWMPGRRHGQVNYEPSKRRITCPNGATIHVFSAEEPERLRGPQCEALWADEIGAWQNATKTWDNAMFGLRLGDNPQGVATTTPRPTELVKSLMADRRSEENPEGSVAVTGGSTFENAKNLAKAFIAKIVKKYKGTRLGDQELYGKLLLDLPGALWSASLIEQFRIRIDDEDPDPPLRDMDIYRMVVGVDPMALDVTNKQAQDMEGPPETGIVAVGLGPFDEAYVLEDASMSGSPAEWATAAIRAYRHWRADSIVAEANNGGAMVKHTISSIDPSVNVELVHASRGKLTRAEPVSALYQQGRVHHVGQLPVLEDQMTTYTGRPGEKSPDRMDALVWAVTKLMVGDAAGDVDDTTLAAFDWQGYTQWGIR
jgi:phage terminase large subunit-like protein